MASTSGKDNLEEAILNLCRQNPDVRHASLHGRRVMRCVYGVRAFTCGVCGTSVWAGVRETLQASEIRGLGFEAAVAVPPWDVHAGAARWRLGKEPRGRAGAGSRGCHQLVAFQGASMVAAPQSPPGWVTERLTTAGGRTMCAHSGDWSSFEWGRIS
jgi:hypothetical protein